MAVYDDRRGKNDADYKTAGIAGFFVSHVDPEDDSRLEEFGREYLQERLAIARLVFQGFEEIFFGPKWEFLDSRGATVQRPPRASTSTEDPEYSDVIYVESLVG